ncbi:hypothetical protein EC844_12550 [Acinetobacter calcoaceticus]|uniref:Uncharacterized protein n=1 Tax=Acinetobacter calcoaceticus TaxID=471 RepID=A0A4R1XHP9_ACICA|nr:hypothetical protein EC844_12550 [Acinetobacter calcoaceticus]
MGHSIEVLWQLYAKRTAGFILCGESGMRLSKLGLAWLVGSSVVSAPIDMFGRTSGILENLFTPQIKQTKSKRNKVSQKKRRLNQRRLGN